MYAIYSWLRRSMHADQRIFAKLQLGCLAEIEALAAKNKRGKRRCLNFHGLIGSLLALLCTKKLKKNL